MKKITASELSVGMQIVGQKSQTSKDRNIFKVKHIAYSENGKFVNYKADKVSPNFEALYITFTRYIKDEITIL